MKHGKSVTGVGVVVLALLGHPGQGENGPKTEPAVSPIDWFKPRTPQRLSREDAMWKVRELPKACFEHTIIYDPKVSQAASTGQYESIEHGTYNHGPRIVLYQDKFIVTWSHHSDDEGGPGGCYLGKVGTFSADRSAISWGGKETLMYLSPPPVPVRLRERERSDPKVIDALFSSGTMTVIGDRLCVDSVVQATHGFTDRQENRGRRVGDSGCPPLPADQYQDAVGGKFTRNGEIYWTFGGWIQQWEVKGNTIVPTSPMYRRQKEMPDKVEVTPGRFKTLGRVHESYRAAPSLSEASKSFQDDIHGGARKVFSRHPRYASPTAAAAAADGINHLAHSTEFRRPDGKWVVIRDNLLNGEKYYAAVKDKESDFYPPAILTNLPGYAMPVAGELPNGWVWLIGDWAGRRNLMYLTMSRDGRTFDRTWKLLYHAGVSKGGRCSKQGPAYFQAVTVGDNLWVAFSVSKCQIWVTRISISQLIAQYEQEAKEG